MKEKILLAVKGMLMGAANVIPGVSGGTMALLTGIFEPLINAIKSFDLTALKLAVSGKFREFMTHTNLGFLIPVGLGIFASILSIARLLEFLFEQYAVFVWAFFFGLILASVWFIGRRIQRVSPTVILLFAIGTAAAAAITLMEPAAENTSLPYLLVCGMVAMCSMILPGLSGSYVLLMMGNYRLVMIDAVNQFNPAVLLPVAVGAGVGLLLFARILSWVFQRFHDQTLALLTGFIFGSLAILWPWKDELTESFGEKVKVVGYAYNLPTLNAETAIAVAVLLAGVAAIVVLETTAARKQ